MYTQEPHARYIRFAGYEFLIGTVPYIALHKTQPGPLFQFTDGSFLNRKLLQSSGIDSTPYSGHSFRIVAATIGARVGMNAVLIQTLGRRRN